MRASTLPEAIVIHERSEVLNLPEVQLLQEEVTLVPVRIGPEATLVQVVVLVVSLQGATVPDQAHALAPEALAVLILQEALAVSQDHTAPDPAAVPSLTTLDPAAGQVVDPTHQVEVVVAPGLLLIPVVPEAVEAEVVAEVAVAVVVEALEEEEEETNPS